MATPDILRIGTRGSDLALFQARLVARLIESRLGRRCALVTIETSGDRDRTSPIGDMGTVGVFTKEIERALLAGEIDLAVHSLKDLPTRLPQGLALAAVPERVAPNDVLVGRVPLAALPAGARIGTSSRRRRAQAEALTDGRARCVEIRGNVPTRIEKCRRGDYDAVILAAAGLDRLELELKDGLGRFDLPIDAFVPAPAQGALGIETRAEDAALFAPLHDERVGQAVAAERELLRRIEGGCTVPLGAHARVLEDGRIDLLAVLEDTVAGVTRLRRARVRARSPAEAARMAFAVLRPDGRARAAAFPGKTIVLTRPDPDLARAIEAAGGRAWPAPAIATEPIEPCPVLPRCRWTLVTSRNAARLLAGVPLDHVGAVGPGTAEELALAGIAVDLVAESGEGGAGLAEAFLGLGEPRGTSVLLPQAREARPELGERLAAAGYDVRAVAIYQTRRLDPALPERFDAIVFASPSAVRDVRRAGARVVAIGATTAGAARKIGLEPVVAARPTTAGVIAALEACFEGRETS